MIKRFKILLIEDKQTDAELIARQLKRDGLECEIVRVETREQMILALQSFIPDIVISDFTLVNFDGLEALRTFKEYNNITPFITLADTGAEDLTLQMMKEGSDDYVLKKYLKRLSYSIITNIEKKKLSKEKMETENELVESEKAFRLLADNSSDIISRHSITGEFIYASPALFTITGYQPYEVIGKKLKDFLHVDDVDTLKKQVTGILTKNRTINSEYRFLKKNGEYIWIETSAKGIVNEHTGKKDEIVAVTRDASQRKKTEESLILSEERYRIIAETASDVIVTIDEKNTILFINPAVEKIFGYKPEEVLGQSITILMPDRLKDKHEQGMQRYLLSGEKKANWAAMETAGMKKNGDEIDLEISLGKSSINQYLFSAIIRDITERKVVQNMLMESSNRLALIYNTSSDMMFLLGTEENDIYRFISANQSFRKVTRLSEENLIGRKVEDIFTKKIADLTIAKIREAIETRQPIKFDAELELKTGNVFLETILTAIYDKNNTCTNILGASRDVTEETATMDRLRRSENDYRLLAENATDMITKHDLDGKYFYVSTASYLLLGYAPEDLIGKSAFDFLHPDDRDSIRQGIDAFINLSLGVYTASYRYRRKDGSYTWIESTNKILYKEGSDEIEGVIAVSRDITERKKFEDKLEDKIKELDTFIYRSSHDLKGPLASLLGLVNIAKTELKEQQSIEYMSMIERSVRHLDSILMDLLNITRITQGKLKNTKVDFRDLINNTVKSFENLEEFNKIDFQVNIQQHSEIFFDKTLLNNILHNLIINAIKYKDKRKTYPYVYIDVRQKQDMITLLIEDNGEGISEQLQKNVFDMFFRGNTKSSGSGLGLYIVKSAVEKLGGTIEMESKEGEGTKFRINLPVVSPEVLSFDF